MSDRVKAAWIVAVTSVLAAVLGAILGRPVINEVTGTTERLERLLEENKNLRVENSELQAKMKSSPPTDQDSETFKNIMQENKDLKSENSRLEARIKEYTRSDDSDASDKIVNDLHFELRGCKAEGSNILCSFLITNLAGDRNFELSFMSGMVAADGEPHRAERLFAGRELLADNADIPVATKVPTAFSFRFPGLAASVQRIALLEIKSRGFSVQWRNIEVSS